MKTTKKQFAEFEKECRRLQRVMGLTDFDLSISHSPGPSRHQAGIEVDSDVAAASIFLNTDTAGSYFVNISEIALHEMCHLLIADLDALARARFVTDEEIFKTDEKLTNRLVTLLTPILKKGKDE